MMKLASPVRRVVDSTQPAGFVALLFLFVGFFATEFLVSWRFVQSVHDVASLFNAPVIILALVVGFALGSFWERRE